MKTWESFNKQITGGEPKPNSSAWDAFNAPYKEKAAFEESRSQKGVDPTLYQKLREKGVFSKDIRTELAPQKTGAPKEVAFETAKFVSDKALDFADQMIRNIRGVSQLVATPFAGQLALTTPGVSAKQAMAESLKMARDVMVDKNVSIDKGVEDAAQMWLKKRKIGKYGGNKDNIIDWSVLAALGYFNLFGDPLFEAGAGFKGAKTLKELALTGKVKVITDPEAGELILKNFVREFPEQAALPPNQLSKEATDLILNTKQVSGQEIAARIDGEDLIIRPKIKVEQPGSVEVKPLETPVTQPGVLPEIKTSRLALGVEEKAIQKSLTEGFENLPDYAVMNIEAQAKAAADLLKSDIDKAVRVALGQELPPEGVIPESVFIAVENQALKTKNVELLQELANSRLTSEATAMGQRIRMLGERRPTSPVSVMRDVTAARKARLSDKIKGEVDQVRKSYLKPRRGDWEAFVKSIEC